MRIKLYRNLNSFNTMPPFVFRWSAATNQICLASCSAKLQNMKTFLEIQSWLHTTIIKRMERDNPHRSAHVNPIFSLTTSAGVCYCLMDGSSIIGQLIARGLLTHWGRDEIDVISQTILSNAFSWMKMNKFRLRFYWSLFPGVQSTIFQHWFR